MANPDAKQPPKVTIKIVSVEFTPAQRHTWEKFWKRLLFDVKKPPGSGTAAP